MGYEKVSASAPTPCASTMAPQKGSSGAPGGGGERATFHAIQSAETSASR